MESCLLKKETSIGAQDTGPNSELTSEFLSSITLALDKNQTRVANNLAKSLHYADLADLLENLAHFRREELVETLRDDFDPNVLAELTMCE